jgi:phosphoribosylformylglycinamidine synthase
MDLKSPGNLLYVIGETFQELGGSEYYKLKGYLGASVPKVKGAKAKRTFKVITKAIDMGLVKSCHDLSEGGLAVAAAEMAFAGDLGAEVDLSQLPGKGLIRNDFALFSESNSRFLLEVSERDRQDFEDLMRGKSCNQIGKVTASKRLAISSLDKKILVDASVAELRRSWKKTLSPEEATR